MIVLDFDTTLQKLSRLPPNKKLPRIKQMISENSTQISELLFLILGIVFITYFKGNLLAKETKTLKTFIKQIILFTCIIKLV